jgi:hypothetical protein
MGIFDLHLVQLGEQLKIPVVAFLSLHISDVRETTFWRLVL